MNADQRRGYFRRWAAACAVQQWDAKDEALRRDVTLEATGKQSTKDLGQDDITLLYKYLDWLADPNNLDKAMDAINPEKVREDNARRRFTHAIERLGFNDAYIAPCAKSFCAAEGKDGWRNLSSTSFQKLFYTLTTRARQRDGKEGKRKPFEYRDTPNHQPYHQRPATKARRAAAREPQVVPRPGVVTGPESFPF